MTKIISLGTYTKDMSPDSVARRTELEAIGCALYGRRDWHSASLAREMAYSLNHFSDEDVSQWRSGQTAMPPGVLTELRALCSTRTALLAALAAKRDPQD